MHPKYILNAITTTTHGERARKIAPHSDQRGDRPSIPSRFVSRSLCGGGPPLLLCRYYPPCLLLITAPLLVCLHFPGRPRPLFKNGGRGASEFGAAAGEKLGGDPARVHSGVDSDTSTPPTKSRWGTEVGDPGRREHRFIPASPTESRLSS